jgi:protoporphyrinogen oxidase
VVSTLPPAVLRRLVTGSLPALEPASVEYLGVVVEVLLLRATLSPYYVLNLADPTLPFTGVIEMTNLAPPGTFGSEAVVYLPRYLPPGDPYATRSDDDLRREFHGALARVFPSFGEGAVVASSIQRAPFVQPIHTVGYEARRVPSRVAPGLWIASSAQVYPWPVNNDQILRRALAVTAEIDRDARVSAIPPADPPLEDRRLAKPC